MKTINKKGQFEKGSIPWNKGDKFDRFRNENNYGWKGEKVGYTGLHQWLRRNLGKPKVCAHCGTINAKKYEWANVSKKYLRTLDDWIGLCCKCHAKFDKRTKKVIQKSIGGEVIKVWESISEAERNGFDSGHISKCCKKKPRYYTHKGYKWEYA